MNATNVQDLMTHLASIPDDRFQMERFLYRRGRGVQVGMRASDFQDPTISACIGGHAMMLFKGQFLQNNEFIPLFDGQLEELQEILGIGWAHTKALCLPEGYHEPINADVLSRLAAIDTLYYLLRTGDSVAWPHERGDDPMIGIRNIRVQSLRSWPSPATALDHYHFDAVLAPHNEAALQKALGFVVGLTGTKKEDWHANFA